MAVTRQAFGKAKDGQELSLFTIDNGKMQVEVTDLGATIQAIIVPDRNGTMTDVALGYDGPDAYYENTCYFGAVIGRSGNRIDKGHFVLNGKEYQLDVNDNENNLHSGLNGFDNRVWTVEKTTENAVSFFLKDADMEQNYPGNFQVSVTYTLTEDNALELHYEAECDQDTVANLTNHTYFNLSGHNSGSVEDQELMLVAKRYNPVIDFQAIPTGELAAVEGTVFDFTSPHRIGERIGADEEQLAFVKGYDHNWLIRDEKGEIIRIAEAYSRQTGICLEAFTDLPAVQFYAGNCITPGQIGKGGAVYQPRCGFCLETQFVPNAINMDNVQKPILKAGDKYDTVTRYRFSVR